MNLAVKDIQHSVGRFVLTAMGLGTLLMLVLGMGGIYQGLIAEATLLVDRMGADLWIVQKDTRGPFAELSRLPASVEDRARAVPGVARAEAFISHTLQRDHDRKPMRFTLQGLSWPNDKGEWLPMVAGRHLSEAHYETVVDQSLGLAVGEKLTLGKDVYTVVGLTRGMVSMNGDAMAFLTLRDAQRIQFDVAGEAVRVERAARVGRLGASELGSLQPQLRERAGGPSSSIPALGTSLVSAVAVHVAPGNDPDSVRRAMSAWPDVAVHSHEDQRGFLLRGNVDRARRQLGLFAVLLVIVSAIIMALILYTMTLDKLHDIAMLKLMGARNGLILGLILQQALLLGALGYAIAYGLGLWVFPRFPRRVVIVRENLVLLGGVVLAVSVLASLLGVYKALRVQPNEVLS